MSQRIGRWYWGPSILLAQALSWAISVCHASEPPEDLTALSIEELINIEVTSVSKKSQKLSEAAAAVTVITQDDIRRSGATSIPELLRMVPGLEVARIDANKWAITARGFNGRFANKLLVMIDGRSVYSSIFAGVNWDTQGLVLKDIERIEVVLGPGGTLWGANAVNGVINIITRNSQNTQGGAVSAGFGTEERGFGSVRYGDRLGEHATYRIYAKYFNRDDSVGELEQDINDQWNMGSGGFRMDWQVASADLLTLQGDLYNGHAAGELFAVTSLAPPESSLLDEVCRDDGGNVLGRWRHTISTSSDFQWQFYYDRAQRRYETGGEALDTFDLDFQHRFPFTEQQEIVWGIGSRLIKDDFDDEIDVILDPQSRTTKLYSAFAQDNIMLVKNQLQLTLGSKFEHNDFSGFGVQPNARLLWTPDKRQSIWTAVSRAVRTPSRVEADGQINVEVYPAGSLSPDPRPGVVALVGNRDFDAEDLVAYELGYRVQPTEALSLDLATFYNVYDNLRTLEPGSPVPNSSLLYLLLPQDVANRMKGETYGGELAANWQALDWWRLRLGYSYLQMQLEVAADSGDTTSEAAEGDSPHHQFMLHSSMDLPKNVEFDANGRYVDRLQNQDIDGYFALDLRLGWRPTKNWELAVVGQNLLDAYHPEYRGEVFSTVLSQVERSVYAKVTWLF